MKTDASTARTLRYVLAAAVVVAAFLSSYSFALARGGGGSSQAPVPAAEPARETGAFGRLRVLRWRADDHDHR
jgi:hypothetical protein